MTTPTTIRIATPRGYGGSVARPSSAGDCPNCTPKWSSGLPRHLDWTRRCSRLCMTCRAFGVLRRTAPRGTEKCARNFPFGPMVSAARAVIGCPIAPFHRAALTAGGNRVEFNEPQGRVLPTVATQVVAQTLLAQHGKGYFVCRRFV